MQKTRKGMVAIVLAIVIVLSLAACGTAQTASAAGTAGTAEAAATANTESGSGKAEYTIVIGSADGSGGITHQGMQKFEQMVEERSGGKVDVQIYMDSLLGGEREITEGQLLGTIQMSPVSEGIYDAYDDAFAILELPYMFSSYDAFNAACDGKIGDYLNEKFKEYGFTSFGIFSMGFRGVINNIRTIETPEDLKGLKLRVPEVDSYLDCFNALGANPTPMNWSDIYTALQQGTVDGMEGSPPVLKDSRFQEVSKYFTVTNHIMSTGVFTISTAYYESLPEDIQTIVRESAEETVAWLREAFVNEWSSVIDEFHNVNGIEITYLTEEQYNAFKDLVMPLYDSIWYAKYGRDILETCMSYSE